MLNVLCKRDWCVVEMYPVWAIWCRYLAPSSLSTYPPPYLPGVQGSQIAVATAILQNCSSFESWIAVENL
jgi:hypothetical protein